jgi:hypothetical protein
VREGRGIFDGITEFTTEEDEGNFDRRNMKDMKKDPQEANFSFM